MAAKAKDAPAAEPVASYWDTTLNRAVQLYGHTYKPGLRHVVDDITLTLMGDAVETKAAHEL